MTRILAIGAGAWGKNIVATLHAMGALSGIVEGSAKRREELRLQYPGLPVFESLAEAPLGTYDAATVATPAETHYEIARLLLESGKDVFVEKPVTLNRADAQALVKLAGDQGRLLMAGHLLLYQPAIRFVKDAIASGKIGKLLSLHQERLNLGRARRVENALWSLGVHDVAVLLYLQGSSPSAVSFSGQAALNGGIEDDTYVHMSFGDGSQAHVHNSWLWPERRRRLTVIGDRAMLVYDELEQKIWLHKKGVDAQTLESRDAGVELVFEGASEPLRLEMEHFAECVRTRKEPESGAQNTLAVMDVLERARP
jgi:predicted dehydrogenase